ncbi:MAG: hypothetical protein IVW57_12995, partial [Ktedonobacterales bacterium]|nr:hypothetical protein [Ktedonobacterales bacterium]
LRLDLRSGAPTTRVIARASAAGHLLADPSMDGSAYYWADVWVGQDAHLHSMIWRGDETGHTRAVSSDDGAFHPRVTRGTLLWIEARNAGAGSATPGDLTATGRALDAVSGALEARTLSDGRQWQLASAADAGSLQAAGPFVLWRVSARTSAYDLRSDAAAGVGTQLSGAAFVGGDATALTWDDGSGSIAVLDL